MLTSTDALTRATRLVANTCAATNAKLFTRVVLEEWRLSDMAEEASEGVAELVDWILHHSPAAYAEVVLVWDGPLLFTEVLDHGHELPLGPLDLRCRTEARGAEHNDRGRCVWASYRTGRIEQLETAA